MIIVNERISKVKDLKEDFYSYMKKDKKMSEEDISEVQMILSMMDQAITLLNMKKRI